METTGPRCSFCERVQDDEEGWFDVDVRVDEGEYYLWFCSQEHAGEWFRRPLPEPDEGTVIQAKPGEEVVGWLVFATIVLLVLGLLGIGLWTVIRWLFFDS
ncbi:hypothetical protein [Amycolatopsis sacchari]|uniref:hypothetical protein n=1 Tax=Amycolatopsis sacchari TaxID=115433 RepID=UPI003D755D1E